ncbi:MAG: hypothetical protein ABFS56_33900 [Pseudomonadota bacterium]
MVKTPWKKAASVWADKNYRLHLTMEDGEKFELYLTPLINSRFLAFESFSLF